MSGERWNEPPPLAAYEPWVVPLTVRLNDAADEAGNDAAGDEMADDYARLAEPSARKTPVTSRPRIEDRGKTIEARKPWLKLEMSRRTWYRRQAEKRNGWE